MAAMASMMMKAPAAIKLGAVTARKSSVMPTSTSTSTHFNTTLRSVKCMAKGDKDPQEESAATGRVSSTSNSQKLRNTSFRDLFAFSGAAPELINGRAAMLGFVAAIGVEAATGRDLISQLNSGGVSWIVLIAGLLTVASLVPLVNGISADSKSKPFFSSSAEMLNGRSAMLGLIALAVTEYVKGGPLV